MFNLAGWQSGYAAACKAVNAGSIPASASINYIMKETKALFLDRDGVINHNFGYVHKIEDFKFIEGIFDLVRAAKQKEYLIIIVTNQAGIGRGLYSEADFLMLTEWMKLRFKENNSSVDDVFFSPFHPKFGIGEYKKDSFHRKPNPGMLLDAQKKYNITFSKSILIGDKNSDIEAGLAAGIPTNILFSTDLSCEESINIKLLSSAIKYL